MERLKLPELFVKESFESWLTMNTCNDIKFYFDKTGTEYIEFGTLFQVYNQNFSVTFGGTEVEDVTEVFRQLNDMKTEMLDKLSLCCGKKSISFSYNLSPSLDFTLQDDNWIHCEELTGLGSKKQILLFGQIDLYTAPKMVDYSFHTSSKPTLQDIMDYYSKFVNIEGKKVYLSEWDLLKKWDTPLWKLKFPTYRVAIVLK